MSDVIPRESFSELGRRGKKIYFSESTLGVASVSNSYLRLNGSCDRLCGLVVRVLGYRSRGLDSIPCAARFSEK
jgi:hypothetical protein